MLPNAAKDGNNLVVGPKKNLGDHRFWETVFLILPIGFSRYLILTHSQFYRTPKEMHFCLALKWGFVVFCAVLKGENSRVLEGFLL